MNLKVFIANLLWFAYSFIMSRKWRWATRNVEAQQTSILLNILQKNAETLFGKAHAFSTIEIVEDYQKYVQPTSYNEYAVYIDEIADGAPRVLTTDHILRFGVSSGSTRASKLIPYTTSLINEFQAGIDPWIFHLMCNYPRIIFGKAYWSLTPVGSHEQMTKGGIPIGFGDEREYFGRFTRWVFETIMIVPPELVRIRDMEAFRYATLRFLIQEKDLSWISIWNPTFMTTLFEPLMKYYDHLVEDVEKGTLLYHLDLNHDTDMLIRSKLKKMPERALELTQIRAQGDDATIFEKIWPKLRLVSSWTHGHAESSVWEITKCFPSARIQPKGLVATEAFVSFPYSGDLSALALSSHFFEFMSQDDHKIYLAHEVEEGKRYSVIVTTSGGLYRYQLHDLIEVADFVNDCPLIRFIGREDKVVDLFGEKLNEQFVAGECLKVFNLFGLEPKFWLCAPEQTLEKVAYTLFFQCPTLASIPQLSSVISYKLDEFLCRNYHYDYCRRLGQLNMCRLFIIDETIDPSQTYLNVCTELGQRLGDIKPVRLHSYTHWSEKFKGKFA